MRVSEPRLRCSMSDAENNNEQQVVVIDDEAVQEQNSDDDIANCLILTLPTSSRPWDGSLGG